MPEPDLLPIADAHALLARTIGAAQPLEGLADENLQSRLRGLTLMALSNASGAMVVSTGNKSELAVGYATLYGDMCGGIAPIGDLTKGQVYALARWMNDHHVRAGFGRPPVPEGSITKPPSAELRPDQRDQDTLPPYDELDAIVHGFVDLEQSPSTISRRIGLDEAMVRRWCLAIDRAQYKREQAGVVPKLTARAFGPGRRLPLAMRES
jgi:NAD+ synthetase